MIKRGHYQSKASLNSEKPEIIRVLGPRKSKPGYFVVQGDKDYSEFEIENEYVFMETVPLETAAPKKNIFDFEPIEVSDEPKIDTVYIGEDKPVIQSNQDIIPKPNITPKINSDESSYVNIQEGINLLLSGQQEILSLLKNPDNTFDAGIDKKRYPNIDNSTVIDISILDKIKTSTLTKDSNRKTYITVPIELPLDYDITKAKSIADLFEIPLQKIIKDIVNQTFINQENHDVLINNIINSVYTTITTTNETESEKQSNINVNDNHNDTGNTSIIDSLDDNNSKSTKIVPDTDIDINIDSEIESISDFLNTFK